MAEKQNYHWYLYLLIREPMIRGQGGKKIKNVRNQDKQTPHTVILKRSPKLTHALNTP